MAIHRKPTVVDRDGARARIREFVVGDAEAIAVVVELSDRACVTLPATALRPHAGGGYAILGRWTDFARERAGGVEVPVIAEQVTVDVRRRPRETVRIRRSVAVEDRLVETPLTDERIELERAAVDVVADTPPQPRQDGDTLVVPIVEEEAVVVRRYRVREELRIRVVRTPRIDRRSVRLRRHEVAIERDPIPPRPDNPEPPEGDRS
ncbi:MAG TPA: DUF2382 domain-containing protein [Kofleriaceae bacterium]|nr:DUF2382 domain-containing protein [Kofleriaceae bacterium]